MPKERQHRLEISSGRWLPLGGDEGQRVPCSEGGREGGREGGSERVSVRKCDKEGGKEKVGM